MECHPIRDWKSNLPHKQPTLRWTIPVWATIFVLTLVSEVHSKELSKISLNQCTVREVAATMTLESIEREAMLAEEAARLGQSILKLIAGLEESESPVVAQLNDEDAFEYARLLQVRKTTNLSLLVESKRQRDLDFIGLLTDVAERTYRQQNAPEKASQQYVPYQILHTMRVLVQKQKQNLPSSTVCSLEVAIVLMRRAPQSALSKVGAGPASKLLEEILSKYGLKEVDENLMSKSDLETIEQIRKTFSNAKHHFEFLADLGCGLNCTST